MSTAAANWYPDPTSRHELRYWNGTAWTDHVSNAGVTGLDPVSGPAPAAATPTATAALDRLDAKLTVGNETAPEKLRAQVSGTGIRGAGIADAPVGGGTLFTEPVLVVNQKAKIIELNNQYSVFDRDGRQLAAVNQVGQTTAKKALRLVSSLDQYMTHKLEITDPTGTAVLKLTRPRKVIKSTIIVTDGADREIGRVVQANAIGKINFKLMVGEQQLGAIRGENWRAWNFRIDDAHGTEVARITKTWEGLAKTMFTTADNYVVQIHTQLAEPLRSLVIASALSVDTALKQDARGLG